MSNFARYWTQLECLSEELGVRRQRNTSVVLIFQDGKNDKSVGSNTNAGLRSESIARKNGQKIVTNDLGNVTLSPVYRSKRFNRFHLA